jgi:hypothetical protein
VPVRVASVGERAPRRRDERECAGRGELSALPDHSSGFSERREVGAAERARPARRHGRTDPLPLGDTDTVPSAAAVTRGAQPTFARSSRPNPKTGSRPGAPRSATAVSSRARIDAAVDCGCASHNSAAAPDTCGVAIDVPDMAA